MKLSLEEAMNEIWFSKEKPKKPFDWEKYREWLFQVAIEAGMTSPRTLLDKVPHKDLKWIFERNVKPRNAWYAIYRSTGIELKHPRADIGYHTEKIPGYEPPKELVIYK